MPSFRDSLTRELENVGITRAAVDAIWPEWWTSGAEESVSATTEVRYTVARRLGISPSSMLAGEPQFIWRDDAKFKNLGDTTPREQAAITSFGMSVGRALISAAPNSTSTSRLSPIALREAILQKDRYVSLPLLLRACWSVGIPVIKSNLSPLRRKAMQAMSIASQGRHAILIGRDTNYPAWTAFVVSHELGHIFNGHVDSSTALLEMDDPLRAAAPDEEEVAADRFALTLLTGRPEFPVIADVERYSSYQLEDSLLRIAPQIRVDPGVLALCLAHNTGRWAQSFAALQRIPRQHLNTDVGRGINWLASQSLAWDQVSDERAAYIRTVMGPLDAL